MSNKDSWVRATFNTCNFSFILSGGGEYRRNGIHWQVAAPCVITQWPNEHVEYGPAGKWQAWEELFIIYHRRRLPFFKAIGFLRDDKPVWYINDSAKTQTGLTELMDLVKEPGAAGTADRIDRACERIIMESLMGEQHPATDASQDAVNRILARVRKDFAARHDFDALAVQQGLSPSTFRRLWARRVNVPPVHYLMQLRIREARRLLMETDMTVGEIAAALNFQNPLYFSRRFKQETGVTATEYRQEYRNPLHRQRLDDRLRGASNRTARSQ